jgi:hypothetical protein
MLSAVCEDGGTVIPSELWRGLHSITTGPLTLNRRRPDLAQISMVRRWLGDEAVGAIELPYYYDLLR